MDRTEIVAQLESLARDGGDIAKVQAIKLLLTLPEHAGGADDKPADPFNALDTEDDLTKRRKDRSQAS